MQSFKHFAVLGVVSLAATCASAAPVPSSNANGVINLASSPDGDVIYSGTGQNLTLTFMGPGSISAPMGTGTFSPFVNGLNGIDTATFFNFGTASLSSVGTQILSITENGVTVNFFAQSDTVPFTNNNFANIALSGFVTETGFSQNNNATLFLSTQSINPAVPTSYSATLVASAPEPSSLALLGTGLVSVAGVLVRRRNAA